MVKHRGTKTIQTERLCLRKYNITDAEDIFLNYGTDERVTRFLSWQPYDNIESLRGFISAQIASYADNVYTWVIRYADQTVGSISVVRMDEQNESCEIGYCLGYPFWNKGIMAEAVWSVLDYLFYGVGYHRIFAKHDAENPASGKVMVKCNMIYEGRLREHYLRHDGTRSDSMVYSALKNEWCTQTDTCSG